MPELIGRRDNIRPKKFSAFTAGALGRLSALGKSDR
jgi:hypothetical protein